MTRIPGILEHRAQVQDGPLQRAEGKGTLGSFLASLLEPALRLHALSVLFFHQGPLPTATPKSVPASSHLVLIAFYSFLPYPSDT